MAMLPGNPPPDDPGDVTPGDPSMNDGADEAESGQPDVPAEVPAYPSGYPVWAAAPPVPPAGAEPTSQVTALGYGDKTPGSQAAAPPVPPAGAEPTPYGSAGPPSSWQQPAWGAPWQAVPPPPPAPPHRLLSARNAILAGLFIVSAGGGAAVGAIALGHTNDTAATASSSTSSPRSSGSSGSSSNGSGVSGSPAPTAPPANSTGPIDVAAVAAKVDPAVVDITVTLGNGAGTAQGTGMVITSGGEVLTNNHVIDGATTIKVQIAGTGPSYSARVLGYDVADDVALLQLQNAPANLPTITIGDPTQLAVGDSILALGNALGRGGTPTPTTGNVIALGQTITASDGSGNSETLSGLIEVNAHIQPGDSGGPLVDSAGNVLGMDTAASVNGRFRFGNGATQGFAIPIDQALTIVHQIESGAGGGNITVGDRAILGVQIQNTTGSTPGAAVAGVQSGSPAANAGIAAGDIITKVGNSDITSATDLQAAMRGYHPGDKVSVTWVDGGGRQHSATLTLVAGPPA
jgi:S1-C subfamily serine protease